MFKENMIAPCGLNCSICSQALRKENLCTGCLGPDQTKSEYCATMCKIAACDIRKSLADRFCDQCPQYPCSEMVEKEIWYANTYPMIESLLGNLSIIRKKGWKSFCRKKWKDGDVLIVTGLFVFIPAFAPIVAKNIQIEPINNVNSTKFIFILK